MPLGAGSWLSAASPSMSGDIVCRTVTRDTKAEVVVKKLVSSGQSSCGQISRSSGKRGWRSVMRPGSHGWSDDSHDV